ncbi:BTAD domain-containing putative transcriptional regulator [Streptomyces sp. TX20-6-3]|uniref:AfsR/SARP family transcriptional regulator n=1 Tax=Streptomyces sp. TX20-6-3 TaxID=3028705 RepID=UPI0029AD4132|nr:BTAD domain-containing putative transcriptional regulator [Streptomyces sp. TX20-6-3]MDX2560760.1 BTAD domain-containing putative transcriptional regulator [Streptomyces sp. TX20-6-3]
MPCPSAHPAASPGRLRFTVLGPLTVTRGERAVHLGPLKQRMVLATLLASVNSPVSVDALTEAVWPEEPPRTARKNIQVYVSALRALFGPDDREARDRPRLTHTGGGYVLRATEEELDLLRFRSLVRAAEGQAPQEAARLLRQALDLWQGPPLGDDLRQSPTLAEEAERLRLRHVTAYESWAEAELELGGAPAVVEGLRDLVERHPLRERLRSAWMRALSGSGRQPEALAVYDDYRQLLARELGLEPSGAMVARYRAILAGDTCGAGAGTAGGPPGGRPAAAPPRATVLLPPDLVDFTGHGDELQDVLDLLESGGGSGGTGGSGGGGGTGGSGGSGRSGGAGAGEAGHVVLLSGPAGSGKTTLAVRAAHLLGGRFPEERLFVSLRDAEGRARPLPAVLAELGERSGRTGPWTPEAWREWLARHRVLVILDDVPEERAVRALLPCGGQGRVLLTARGQLGGLAPVHRIAVPPLDTAEAVQLLAGLVGPRRVRADREAALRIVRACGGSPLAVRVSGMRLAVLRHVPLREFADRLTDPTGALDELTAGDVSVRQRLAHGWETLPADRGRDAGRLATGTGDGPFGLAEAAEALGCDERHAVRVVEALIDAGMVTSPGGEVTAHAARYDMPHLIRLYARGTGYGTPVLT